MHSADRYRTTWTSKVVSDNNLNSDYSGNSKFCTGVPLPLNIRQGLFYFRNTKQIGLHNIEIIGEVVVIMLLLAPSE